jgi:hypothetical protein
MSHPRRLLFVGERRSATAIRMGVTWEDGRVCAGTLHAALATVGIDARDPERVWFMNLWRDQPFEDCQGKLRYWLDGNALEHIRRAAVWWGWTVVGMGRKVQRVLADRGIPHLKLVHPAARGRARKTEAYQAHVAAVLGDAAREILGLETDAHGF